MQLLSISSLQSHYDDTIESKVLANEKLFYGDRDLGEWLPHVASPRSGALASLG